MPFFGIPPDRTFMATVRRHLAAAREAVAHGRRWDSVIVLAADVALEDPEAALWLVEGTLPYGAEPEGEHGHGHDHGHDHDDAGYPYEGAYDDGM